MKTIDKLNKISNVLFTNYYDCLSKAERDIVFEYYLAENAVNVQPKSRSYNGYINFKK